MCAARGKAFYQQFGSYMPTPTNFIVRTNKGDSSTTVRKKVIEGGANGVCWGREKEEGVGRIENIGEA